MARRRNENPLTTTDWVAVGIGAVGGGLAVYLFMNAMLSDSNAQNSQLTAATGTPTTGGTTSSINPADVGLTSQELNG